MSLLPGFGDAEPRFRSLAIIARAATDDAALARLAAAEDEREQRQVTTVIINPEGQPGTRQPGPHEFTWRVWWEHPSRWRDDMRWGDWLGHVAIVREEVAMMYAAGVRTLFTNALNESLSHYSLLQPPVGSVTLPTVANRAEEFPLLRPPFPASSWEVAFEGERRHHGRPARLVRVRRHRDAPEEDVRSGYWRGVAEYECLVDPDLDILVSLVGIADGAAVATVIADEVRADAPLPPELFSFTPPPGTRVAHVQRWR